MAHFDRNHGFGEEKPIKDDDEESLDGMATAVGSVALGMGGVMSLANYVSTGSLHGAEGPVALTLFGVSMLVANKAGNNLPADGESGITLQNATESLRKNTYF